MDPKTSGAGEVTSKSLTYRDCDLHQLFPRHCEQSTPGWFSVTIAVFETLERSCHDD